MTFTAGAIAESPIVSEQKALQVITVKGEKAYTVVYNGFYPDAYEVHLATAQKMIDSFEIITDTGTAVK
jgi:hypothetical protein